VQYEKTVAALEDKIAQQAICTVLNQIYETVFVDFSYGFRENRSQHNALDALYVGITSRKINWILDADIKGFFDNLNHEMLLDFLKKRIGDKRVLRLISKWLKTGFIENGKRVRQEIGTPQGAVISPLLANIYLHYVLDIWVSMWRKTKAKGDMIIVRYADDFVIGFQYYEEAVTLLADLHRRLSKYELTLHPQKTRLIEFGKYASGNRKRKGKGKPETFDFLGFTHMCSKNRKGDFFLRRKTKRKQLKKKLKEVKDELKKRMHERIKETGKWLATVITGHTNYFAVPGNMDAVKEFYKQCMRQWLRTLRRRSHKAQKLTWESFLKKAEELIPRPRMVHPFPEKRFWRQRLEVGAG
jgi:RNA-directed DNA polymerase